MHHDDVPLKDSLLAIIATIVWSLNFLAVYFGLQDVPPFLFLAIRFVFVAFPLVFFIPRPQMPWRVLIGIGVLMSFGQFSLLYLAIDLGMPLGLASLVLQAQVLVTIGLAWLFLGERATRPQILGVVIGMVGLLIIGVGLGEATPFIPFVVCVAAAVAWATGNVVVRSAKIQSGLSLVVWSAVIVPIPCLALSLIFEGPEQIASTLQGFGWQATLSTAYTVIMSSLVGYTLFNSLMARHSAASVVPFMLLISPMTIVIAWLVLDEMPTTMELIGGTVMLGGVALAALTGRRRRRRRAREDPVVYEAPT